METEIVLKLVDGCAKNQNYLEREREIERVHNKVERYRKRKVSERKKISM